MWFTVASIVVIVIFYLYNKFKVPRELQHIPTISPLYSLYSLFTNQSIIEVNIQRNQKILHKHGIALVWNSGAWSINITDLEAAKNVLYDMKGFPKLLVAETFPGGAFAKFVGVNLVFSNGDDWRLQRRIMNPIFKKVFDPTLFSISVNRFIKVIEEYNHKNANLPKGIPIKKFMNNISLEILGRCIFDVDFDCIGKDNIFVEKYEYIIEKTFTAINFILPWFDREYNPFRKRVHSDVKWFRNEFMDKLKEKTLLHKDGDIQGNGHNLLSAMIMTNQVEKEKLSDQYIINNCLMFFLAGHDTTATALTVSLYHLAKYPEIQNRCREEITRIVKGEVPTTEEIRKLEYLNCVIKESLRMFPPLTDSNARVSKKSFEVNGFSVPKNKFVKVDFVALGMDPKVFDNPMKFHPERFLNNKNYGLNYIPFSDGTRQCIGMNFSLDEQRTVLAMILNKYVIDLTNPNQKLNVGFSMLLEVQEYELYFKKL